jgi:hypothetical protein
MGTLINVDAEPADEPTLGRSRLEEGVAPELLEFSPELADDPTLGRPLEESIAPELLEFGPELADVPRIRTSRQPGRMKKRTLVLIALAALLSISAVVAIYLLWNERFWPFATGARDSAFLGIHLATV